MALPTSHTSFELEIFPRPTESLAQNDVNIQEPEIGGHLDPTDGGSSAWKLLIAAFVFEGVLYGFSLSFGVFQNYYAGLPEFGNSPYIPIVGSIATGIAFLGAPFMTPVVKRFPRYQKPMIWFGWILCISGLVAGSFVDALPGLIMTQGVMYGVGFVIFYYPIISMVNEWWVTRRGLAWGIIAGASGASGAVFPFIVESLLKKYGYRTTLRALAMAFFLLTAPLVPFFKPRIPPSQQSAIAKTDWSFLSKPLFWVYCTSNVIQGFGFYFPSLYLPSYASSIGLSTTQGALLLALMSMAQLLGQFTFGFLSDGRVPLNVLALVSTIVAGVASFALWGLARSLAALVVFALVYGFFGYAYVSMRARMGTAVTSDPTGALATFGLFCFGQGVGNVLTGPIGGSLLSSVTSINTYGLMKYKAVVIFTGSCMVLSALSISSWYLRPRRVRAA